MERYFSETELRKHAFLVDSDNSFSFNAIDVDCLDDIPTADVHPNIHAEWVHHRFNSGEPINGLWYCSQCAMCGGECQTAYCPSCGAKMYD